MMTKGSFDLDKTPKIKKIEIVLEKGVNIMGMRTTYRVQGRTIVTNWRGNTPDQLETLQNAIKATNASIEKDNAEIEEKKKSEENKDLALKPTTKEIPYTIEVIEIGDDEYISDVEQ